MGETLHYPTNGLAHVTAAIVTLPPGSRTVLHKHGVPLSAYVLKGEITVDYSDRGKRTYRQGDALMEAMDAAHFGADAGPQPVRILTVYMGAEGAPAGRHSGSALSRHRRNGDTVIAASSQQRDRT